MLIACYCVSCFSFRMAFGKKRVVFCRQIQQSYPQPYMLCLLLFAAVATDTGAVTSQWRSVWSAPLDSLRAEGQLSPDTSQTLCVLCGWGATSAKCESARRMGRAKWCRGKRWNGIEPETVGGVCVCVCCLVKTNWVRTFLWRRGHFGPLVLTTLCLHFRVTSQV